MRIIQRAIRLANPSDEPLAVFRSKDGQYKGQRCFITNALVERFLRRVAQRVYQLSDKDPSLKRWSCHSIRVTACNLLHRQGLSDSYIQTRLRWKSKAFLGYLRNTLYAASSHTSAINISQANLLRLSTSYKRVLLPSGKWGFENDTSGRQALVRFRDPEEIEAVLHARAA